MQTRAAELESLPRTAMERFRDARGEGGIVFDPARLRQANWDTFDPAGYPGAQPVDGAGGRGSAWFVEGEFGQAVIKRYLRGGWMAALNEDAYLWLGEDAVRSRREFALLREMRGAGLPVPAPLAAGWRRAGLTYRAWLMTQRIADVESLVASVRRRGADAPWRAVGEVLARFHRRGMHHADLNAHNVLLARDGAVHVIDWDKGVVEAGPASWCEAVLARLERSLRKRLPDIDPAVLADGMARLREAHDIHLARGGPPA
jgi:3-deoxy-D-manno-octulosonic acid kinase